MSNLLQQLGIELVLLDLDDTLIQTHSIFVQCLHQLKINLAIDCGAPIPEFFAAFETCMLEAKKTCFVDPQQLWLVTFELLRQRFPTLNSRLINEAYLTIQAQIYGQPIPLFPGALELLQLLQTQQVQIGIVTHGDPLWTAFKIELAGIDKLVAPENIFSVDVKTAKTEQHWAEAIANFGVAPQNTLVIGDNVKADVLAALSIGVETAIWINRAGNWSVHLEGAESLDKNKVYIVKDLHQIIKLLLKPTPELRLSMR